jgi:hypothetical protein
MASTLSKPSDKADRTERPDPKRIVQNAGCTKCGVCLVALLGFRVRGYDLRRAPRIHPHFVDNAIRVRFDQWLLRLAASSNVF